jgi:hypothetical protein
VTFKISLSVSNPFFMFSSTFLPEFSVLNEFNGQTDFVHLQELQAELRRDERAISANH